MTEMTPFTGFTVASSPDELGPAALSELRNVVILDVRAAEERFGEMGFIPGSRSFPEEELRSSPARLLSTYGVDQPVALVCLSGKRSLRLVPMLRGLGFATCAHLRGGVLAWRAASLPVCGVGAVPAEDVVPLRSIDEFPRALVSCFVAESVETQLNSGDGSLVDPKPIVERICAEMRPSHSSAQAWADSLDRLAEAARAMGHPLDHIARNVDRMLASLARLESA